MIDDYGFVMVAAKSVANTDWKEGRVELGKENTCFLVSRALVGGLTFYLIFKMAVIHYANEKGKVHCRKGK